LADEKSETAMVEAARSITMGGQTSAMVRNMVSSPRPMELVVLTLVTHA